LFDGDDSGYQTVITSDRNIRKVCQVVMANRDISDEEFLYYARIGDIPPDRHDSEGNAEYDRKRHYSNGNWLAALVPVLFMEGPEILRLNDGKVEVADRQRKDTYIRSEVRRAFDDFLHKFGVRPFEAKQLSDLLANDLTPETIQRLMNPADLPDLTGAEPDSKTTSKAGATPSGKDTDTGSESSG